MSFLAVACGWSAMAAAGTADGGLPDETVVTASRGARPHRDLPATVIVLPRRELAASPTLTTDELLRTVPQVGTFRQTSSATADPTSQGLSLRNVGPGGVSRALVLVDGVPFGEPFGGWVYWAGLPRIGIERIEVVPGPASSLYGTVALGGVVQVLSRPLEAKAVEVEAAGGTLGHGQVSARATRRLGRWGLGAEVELFHLEGYVPVVKAQRGPVDTPAGSDHASAVLRAEWTQGSWTLAARGGYFGEDQRGGTTFTTASVRRWEGSLRVEGGSPASGSLDATVFARVGSFVQQRARIDDGRAVESLAATQSVPTSDLGLALAYRAPALTLGATSQSISIGVDARRIVGRSDERPAPGSTVVLRSAGGEQQTVGVFLQDELSVGWLTASASARVDLFRNVNALRRVLLENDNPDTTSFPDRLEPRLSGRLGVLARPGATWAVRASGGTGFRQPTLNELYRPFQVGTVRTASNEDLVAERVLGAELGLELTPDPALRFTATGFVDLLEDPVSIVSLAAPLPDGATRQRQNLGAATTRGVELAVEARPSRQWTLLAAYVFADARISSAPGNPDLVGRQVPLAPPQRASLLLTFDDPAMLRATVQVQYVSASYEDDRNTLPLDEALVVSASLSRELIPGLEVFLAVQNAVDWRYRVGRAGVDTLGMPAWLRLGVRARGR